MELILQVIFSSVFSGFMLSAAIPNEFYLFGCPGYTLAAFIPLYLVFNKIKDFKLAFAAFFIQTLVTHLISSFWLAYFKDFAIFTLGASAFGTACIGGAFGLFFFLPYYTSQWQNKLNEYSASVSFLSLKTTRGSTVFRILYFATVYTLYEWVKSAGFLGYPWGTVSSAMFRWPLLMQSASITGTYGITFIIVMFNALAAEFLIQYFGNYRLQKKRTADTIQTARLFGMLLLLMLVHGIYQYEKPRKPVKELTTITVQQNSNPWNSDSDENSILTSQRLTKEKLDELAMAGRKADLVVWSEGCLQKAFPSSESFYTFFPAEKPLSDFIQEIKVPCIFGGSFVRYGNDGTSKKFFNASLLYDADGLYRGYYAKNHLVPFAEALPFMEIPPVHAFMEKVVGISAGWAPGDQYVYFDVPCTITENFRYPAVKDINLNKSFTQQLKEDLTPYTVRISTPICFDDAFTDIMRPLFLNGTELFINITDDSWSLKKSSEIQHFVIASYRAIEYRTTLIRSANAGYSVVVDPAGKVISDLPLFEEAAMAVNIPVFQRQMTTYARFGNWLPYLCLLIFAAVAIWSYFTFSPYDYIPDERKLKKSKKNAKSGKKEKKNSKNKK